MKKLRKEVQEEENEGKEPVAIGICVVNKPDTSS